LPTWFVFLLIFLRVLVTNLIIIFFKTAPLSCGSPDSLQNTTIIGKNYTIGSTIEYNCPKGHSLLGDKIRTCDAAGVWSGVAPSCKCN